VTRETTAPPIPSSDLEPSRISDQTYVTRRRLTYVDAAVLLGVTIVLISIVPSYEIVPGLTALGRPGLIVGFLLFCWWILVRCTSHLAMSGRQPMRWALLLFMISALISYAAGFLRGLTHIEANSADRTMLYYCILVGVALTAADGVPNWLRLQGVIQVLVWSAAIVAMIGLIEYLTGTNLTNYMAVPGLSAKFDALGFEARGDGFRVASTTTHYIELAAYLAMALPFAIHLARFGHHRKRRRLALICSLIIAAGIGASISRTGLLAMALMLIVLVPIWGWRTRYNVLVIAVGLVGALGAASPGMFKTLSNLFSSPSSNPAFTVRAARYPMVFHYVDERPWFGRGTGTYIAPQYQTLDNQWLTTLISNGVLGAIALAALSITGIVLASLALRRCKDPADRHLCAVLIATQLIAIAVAGTFDSLSYSTYATIFALSLGLCGAVWRLSHPTRTVRTSTTRWFLDRELEEPQSLTVAAPRSPAPTGVAVGAITAPGPH
jgi:O-antigen ligase